MIYEPFPFNYIKAVTDRLIEYWSFDVLYLTYFGPDNRQVLQ